MTALHVLFYQPPCGKWYVHSHKLYPSQDAATEAAGKFLSPGIPFAAVPVELGELNRIAAGEPCAGLPWRCFHCGDVLRDERAARTHFGADEGRTPACQIKASEGGLVQALREAEDEVERVHTQLHAESADGLRALQNNLGRHRTALVAMEETGYERGLADQAHTVAILRRALAWHGDPQRMATTREEWQQEIDEAIRWVKDNPEEGRPSFPTFVQELPR